MNAREGRRLLTLAGGAVVVLLAVQHASAAPAVPSGNSRPSAVGANARRYAMVMYDAFVKGDLDSFVRYTYPPLVEKMGGAEAMIATIKGGMAGMERDGLALKSATIEMPVQVVEAGEELHALLPMSLTMTAPGGELHAPSHLLGISADKGATWTFIDAGPLTSQHIAELLPSYNPALVLPPKQKPTFVPK